jgi:TctA family transporter
MTIQGLTPGSAMLTKHLDVTYTMIWSVAIANIFGTGLCLIFTNQLARVALVKIHLLAPLIIVVVFLAAFQSTRHYGDLFSLLAFSFLGWLMKRFGWPRPPLILGLVLSGIIENYLFISISRYGAAWMMRPIVIIIGFLIAGSLYYGFRQMNAATQRNSAKAEATE